MTDRDDFIKECYMRYGTMVYRRCRTILNDESAAADATHDVFVRLMERMSPASSGSPVCMSGYLYRMATNVSLNMRRDNRAVPLSADSPVFSSLADRDDPLDRFISRDFVDFVFRNESASVRRIAYLYYAENLTRDEVSSRTGMSVSYIGKTMRKMKARIRGGMADECVW